MCEHKYIVLDSDIGRDKVLSERGGKMFDIKGYDIDAVLICSKCLDVQTIQEVIECK